MKSCKERKTKYFEMIKFLPRRIEHIDRDKPITKFEEIKKSKFKLKLRIRRRLRLRRDRRISFVLAQ
jgi:hypothetical protein